MIHIERLTTADLDAVAVMAQQDMEQLGMRTDLTNQRALFADVLNDTTGLAACWVAKEDDNSQPLGIVLVNAFWSVKFAGKGLWIEQLYVPPIGRRKGLGRLLVEHVLRWALDQGIKGVDLEAYRDNTPAAVLYRSLGFRRLGRERFGIALQDLPIEG
jgi:GNAT superfamily N-acetyltransferase